MDRICGNEPQGADSISAGTSKNKFAYLKISLYICSRMKSFTLYSQSHQLPQLQQLLPDKTELK